MAWRHLQLPFSFMPFAFPTFFLVQALVPTGWVPVFEHGWDNWVRRTGTVGAVARMGFLSVVLCNFAGTNIGATVLSRIIQTWTSLPRTTPISAHTFWGTVYALALGVNYGAFSLSFSASLAGLLWREDLASNGVLVRRYDFARVNLPLIVFSMVVSCAVRLGRYMLLGMCV